MDTNKKSFDLIVRTKETFNLYLYNFQMAVTFFFRIRDKIRITFVSKLSTKMFSVINIKRIKLIPIAKLRESVFLTINSKRVSISYIVRERLKAVTTILSSVTINYVMRLRQRLVTTLYQGILTITFDPILAKFYLLSDFDLDTLADVDVLTLGDMDYIIT